MVEVSEHVWCMYKAMYTGHLYLAVSAPGAADTARRPTGPSAPSGGDSGEGPHLRAYSCSAAPPPNSSESRRAAVAPPATTYLRAPLSAPLSALRPARPRLAQLCTTAYVQIWTTTALLSYLQDMFIREQKNEPSLSNYELKLFIWLSSTRPVFFCYYCIISTTTYEVSKLVR